MTPHELAMHRTTHRAGVISVYDSSVHVWEEHARRDIFPVLVEVGVKVREDGNG